MFGTYRTYLALIVVVHHLLSVPVIGHYAVHGFFILNGYLMTYIMCRPYGFTANGIKTFAINCFAVISKLLECFNTISFSSSDFGKKQLNCIS
jgi:peptidoglycan/LPS O-acetylase OafA/YrhL